MGPWHIEIEQDQIAVAVGFERGGQGGQIAGLLDGGTVPLPGQSLAQRGAEERVIVDNDDAAHGSSYPGLPGRTNAS